MCDTKCFSIGISFSGAWPILPCVPMICHNLLQPQAYPEVIRNVCKSRCIEDEVVFIWRYGRSEEDRVKFDGEGRSSNVV